MDGIEKEDVNTIEDESKLVDTILHKINTHKSEIDEILEQAKKNEEYYFPKLLSDDSNLRVGEEQISVPKVFENLETIIPITTRKNPEPVVKVFPQNEKNKKFQMVLESFLRDQWQLSEEQNGQEMQPKQEENMRNLFCNKIMIYKYLFDPELNKIITEVVPLSKLVFPVKAKDVYSAEFIAEEVEIKLGDLIAKFPDKEEQIRMSCSNPYNNEQTIKYWNYWTNDTVTYILHGRSVFLGRDNNPHWNYPIEQENEFGQIEKIPQYNFFKRPIKPYIVETDIRMNCGMFAKSSLVEINIPLVDGINKRKRQIDRNANLSNGQIVVAGQQMTKETASTITMDANSVIYLDEAESVDGAITLFTGRSIDGAVVEDMRHSENHIDQTTGAYGTVRGEREAQETAEGRTILKESAYTRNEPLFRLNERGAQKLFNAWAQLACVFFVDDEFVQSASMNSNEIETLNKNSFIDKRIMIFVKDGSSIPLDRSSQQAQAFDLAKNGFYSTIDLLKALDVEDPEGKAKRAFLQQNQPDLLYMVPQESVSIDAIRTIMQLLNGQRDPMVEYNNQNIQEYSDYQKTLLDYINGAEIDSGLDTYVDLDEESKQLIKIHLKITTDILNSMVEQEKLINPQVAEEEAMMQQEAAQQPTGPVQ